MSNQKIRIILSALDHATISKSSREIVNSAMRSGARLSGPIPLPKSIRKYTVLRSPHVNKDSREQLQMVKYKVLIDVLEHTPKTMDALMRLDLPAGVNVKVHTVTSQDEKSN